MEIRIQNAPFGSNTARFDETRDYLGNPRVETYTKIPSSKRIRDLNSKLGPGKYRVTSFIEELEKKSANRRGICDTREERFKDNQICTPGPGTYGRGGNPSAALEDKARKYAGTTMGHASQNRFETNVMCSGLGPGTYNLKSSTDHILSRIVSKRGPYDLSTGERNIFTSHKLVSPDPGTYHKILPSFGDHLLKPEKRKHGVFLGREQYPVLPTERIFCSTLSQCPRSATDPGPGWYNNMPKTPKFRLRSSKKAPFLSSAPRMSKKTEMLINKNHNPVGPGRYNLEKLSMNKYKNSYRSSFISGTQRYQHCHKRDKFNQERLRPVNVPLDKSLL